MSNKSKEIKTKYKTVHFVSLGCPKNRVDTEVMAGTLTRDGLKIVSDPEEADVIVVNTCSFIGDAKEESIDALLEMATYRKNGQCQLLVAAGCLPQRNGDELSLAMPEIDKMLGTKNPNKIGTLLKGASFDPELNQPAHFLQKPSTPRFIEPGAPSAYVKIADGCSRKCAFCAIPGIRGKGESRPIRHIVAEIKELVARGVVEFNLVAQDTGAYGRDLADGTDLVGLLEALDKIDGVQWIRLLYLYPDTVTNELLTAMGDLDSVVPYLDIPIQHASTHMLKTMRRGHGPQVLKKVIERAKQMLPHGFLRSTVLVGHPGETQEDVDQLVAFIKWAEFHHLGAFRYSDEQGTPSFGKKPSVSRRDSYNRWRKVMAAQRKIANRANRSLIGREVDVLVEAAADDSGFVMQGRHIGQAPEIDGITYLVSSDAGPGEIVRARIIDHKVHDVVAEPVE